MISQKKKMDMESETAPRPPRIMKDTRLLQWICISVFGDIKKEISRTLEILSSYDWF